MGRIVLCALLIFSPLFLISQIYKKNSLAGEREFYVKTISVKDTAFFSVLDKVLQSETEGKYYSSSASYSIMVYQKEGKNIVKIEGGDNLRLFVDSKELVGCFKYKEHYFFLLSHCDDLFLPTSTLTSFKVSKKQDIVEDDRWAIYYFGYDRSNFYFYECSNYVSK